MVCFDWRLVTKLIRHMHNYDTTYCWLYLLFLLQINLIENYDDVMMMDLIQVGVTRVSVISSMKSKTCSRGRAWRAGAPFQLTTYICVLCVLVLFSFCYKIPYLRKPSICYAGAANRRCLPWNQKTAGSSLLPAVYCLTTHITYHGLNLICLTSTSAFLLCSCSLICLHF